MQKMIKKISIIALATLVMISAATTSVKADGTATRTETVCDTGSYGSQNCHTVTVTIPTHTVVGTALPSLNVVIAALLVTMTLSGVAYFKTK